MRCTLNNLGNADVRKDRSYECGTIRNDNGKFVDVSEQAGILVVPMDMG
jgi:hypothetical protein